MTVEAEINAMPKVELHVHLEGAISPGTYFSLAKKNKINLTSDNLDEWIKYFQFKNFKHFIDVYGLAVSTIKKTEDFSLLIENFFQYQEQNNILYSEAFLSASFIIQNFNNHEILDAIEIGITESEAKYSSRVKLIPDISRHLPETQEKVLEFVVEGYKRGLFIGLGLGGMEANYPPNLFIETFLRAKESGLRLVAHAGEAVGPESIWGAISDLNVERVGHGFRILDDENLVRYLREKQIPVEVSPTSNYNLGLIKESEIHPIRKMVDKGLLCTVNTDDPEMFSTNLSREYQLLYSQGFSMKELYQLNKNAINSSFLEVTEKNKLLHTLEKYRDGR